MTSPFKRNLFTTPITTMKPLSVLAPPTFNNSNNNINKQPIIIPPPPAHQPDPESPKTIIITDERIISFFENHFMEPTKFILSAIENYPAADKPVVNTFSSNEILKLQHEYNKFLNQKKTIMMTLKENIKRVENIEFNTLDSILCDRFGIVKEEFQCTICKTNSYRNKKALSVHQRKCRKENVCRDANTVAAAEEEDDDDENEESTG